jgi:hypothetical protein
MPGLVHSVTLGCSGRPATSGAAPALLAMLAALALLAMLVPDVAQAVPAFARQTGQNCVACHAGGQFPELTPYGRMFKLTGYTIGARTIPVAIMGVTGIASVANTAKSDDPRADFQKNGSPVIATGSLFLAGKITDYSGAFIQATYDNYASQGADGTFHGKMSADNMDFRYADHLIDTHHDLVLGVTLNNSPSVSDPWNTAAAWMQYVPVPSPTSYQFSDGATPYPGFGAGGNLAGVTAYMFWKKTLYLELGTYRSGTGVFSFMSFNIPYADTTQLRGSDNPYWRLAVSHEWGAHNLMIGTSGMIAHVYDGGSDRTDPNNLGRFANTGFDAQYQYILDPHTVTAQLAYMRQVQDYSANTAATSSPFFLADGTTPVAAVHAADTTRVLRAKLSYIYRARYGGSLAHFSGTGTTNTLNQSSGYDSNGQITSNDPLGTGIASVRVNGNLAGNPDTRGYTWEAFWMPWQYLRVGALYTLYDRFNGTARDYDGFGRNASDNNTLFFYVWAAR